MKKLSYVHSLGGLRHFLSTARRGDFAVYHIGHLAFDRVYKNSVFPELNQMANTIYDAATTNHLSIFQQKRVSDYVYIAQKL